MVFSVEAFEHYCTPSTYRHVGSAEPLHPQTRWIRLGGTQTPEISPGIGQLVFVFGIFGLIIDLNVSTNGSNWLINI